MKDLILFIICISFVISSCSSAYHFHDETSNDEQDQVLNFFDEVAKLVVEHDRESFLAIVDPDYKKEQLDDLLKGNETQFLNEFFCGKNLKNDEFLCAKFDDVTSCSLHNISEESKDLYQVIFEIKNKEGQTLRSSFYMHVKNGYFFIYSSFG